MNANNNHNTLHITFKELNQPVRFNESYAHSLHYDKTPRAIYNKQLHERINMLLGESGNLDAHETDLLTQQYLA